MTDVIRKYAGLLIFIALTLIIPESISFADEKVDGFLNGSIVYIDLSALEKLDLGITFEYSEHGFVAKISVSKELADLLKNGTIELDFVILDDTNTNIIATAEILGNQVWAVECSYRLRIGIASRVNYEWMQKGVTYLWDHRWPEKNLKDHLLVDCG